MENGIVFSRGKGYNGRAVSGSSGSTGDIRKKIPGRTGVKEEIRLALHYAKRYGWQYLLGILSLFLVDRINARVPLLSGELTDGLAAGALDMNGVWSIAGYYFFVS